MRGSALVLAAGLMLGNQAFAGPNIVEIAAGDERFSTLVTAVTEAGLADTLQSDGPFTVFAPTNEAFAALPDGVLDGLLADKDALKEVLLYHTVVGAAVDFRTARTLDSADMANGGQVAIDFRNHQLFVNQSKVIVRDVRGSNGIIHAIDKVLIPSGMEDRMRPSLYAFVEGNDNFDILESYLRVAGLKEVLSNDGDFTVFAPTDAAFEKLPVQTRLDLYFDTDALRSILLYHVVGESLEASEVLSQRFIKTLNGRSVRVDRHRARINQSRIIATDVKASNGIAHAIDTVLIPGH